MEVNSELVAISNASLKELEVMIEAINARKQELKNIEKEKNKSLIMDLLSEKNKLGREVYTVAEINQLTNVSLGMIRKFKKEMEASDESSSK
jgi:hypothetical protein